MKSSYSISQRKNNVIRHIMNDERITLAQRQDIVRSLLEVEDDERLLNKTDNNYNQLISNSSSSKAHTTLFFPHLQLFSKKTPITKLKATDIKEQQLQLLYSRQVGYHSTDCFLPIESEPIIVEHKNKNNNRPTKSLIAIQNQLKRFVQRYVLYTYHFHS